MAALPTTLPFPDKNGPTLCSWRKARRESKLWCPRDAQPLSKVDFRGSAPHHLLGQQSSLSHLVAAILRVCTAQGASLQNAKIWGFQWLPRIEIATLSMVVPEPFCKDAFLTGEAYSLKPKHQSSPQSKSRWSSPTVTMQQKPCHFFCPKSGHYRRAQFTSSRITHCQVMLFLSPRGRAQTDLQDSICSRIDPTVT